MTTLVFASGVVAGLLFYELTGLVPGGIIVPGFLALYANQPLRLLATIGAALVTLGGGRLLMRYTIVYGRRKFGMFLLLGIAAKLALDALWADLGAGTLGLRTLGVIIPGLIAREMDRQGVALTLLATAIVTLILYLVLLIIPGEAW